MKLPLMRMVGLRWIYQIVRSKKHIQADIVFFPGQYFSDL